MSFVVKRGRTFIARVWSPTDAETVVSDSGEVPEAAWANVVPLCDTNPERLVWEGPNGWSIQRVGLKCA